MIVINNPQLPELNCLIMFGVPCLITFRIARRRTMIGGAVEAAIIPMVSSFTEF